MTESVFDDANAFENLRNCLATPKDCRAARSTPYINCILKKRMDAIEIFGKALNKFGFFHALKLSFRNEEISTWLSNCGQLTGEMFKENANFIIRAFPPEGHNNLRTQQLRISNVAGR